jgi:hypothetical protein
LGTNPNPDGKSPDARFRERFARGQVPGRSIANGHAMFLNLKTQLKPGLLLKDSYWRWPQRELAGNTIDFFVKVLGLSFNDAMRLITAT